MSNNATAGRIEVRDIEEANYFARPWEVCLRQMSRGPFRGYVDYVQVNGILVYREHWSHRVMATGATPNGFFMFGGPASTSIQINWCGSDLASQNLAYGRSGTEVDFVLPDGTHHLVLLVPDLLLRNYLGEESAEAALRGGHVLGREPGIGDQLLSLIGRLVDKFGGGSELLADDRICKTIEWQLLGSLAEVLFAGSGYAGCPSPRKRFLAVRHAVRLVDGLHRPISVPDLAASVGVSHRVLELAFQETVGISPRAYMLRDRMNSVRRDLLGADSSSSSVTLIAGSWGVTELGRFAVEYKQMFGESPSATLARRFRPRGKRLADVLPQPSNRPEQSSIRPR